jgi:hypothetical protein
MYGYGAGGVLAAIGDDYGDVARGNNRSYAEFVAKLFPGDEWKMYIDERDDNSGGKFY